MLYLFNALSLIVWLACCCLLLLVLPWAIFGLLAVIVGIFDFLNWVIPKILAWVGLFVLWLVLSFFAIVYDMGDRE